MSLNRLKIGKNKVTQLLLNIRNAKNKKIKKNLEKKFAMR
jgi:hypothetical protein